ncbi:helix-turn-helix domain-containing protein [Sorangium sp. So ce1036]|uniref:TetR/AcrR family transcriptional regulator n=1 Tax=Sorangium sp. So ce1036 TaxID=3133328 RepID=UPI003F0D50A7
MMMADGDYSKQRQRAERILDAAAELVLRWGYKRVTIDEVARRANIGKGTVYLHWKTREALFLAVLARDSVRMVARFTEAIREDPAEILLHRVMKRRLLLLKEFPLLQAMFTRDTEVLGNLVNESSARSLQSQKFLATRAYCALLRSHGLLRTDQDPEAQMYALNAAVLGFYVIDPLLPPEARRSVDERAEMTATLVRRAFEPPEPPDPEVLRALAPEVIGWFERMRADYMHFAQGNSTSTRESPEE